MTQDHGVESTRDGHTTALLRQHQSSERLRLLLSVREARDAIGVSHTKFYQLKNAGEFECIKIGRSTRVVVQSLHNYVSRLLAEKSKGAHV